MLPLVFGKWEFLTSEVGYLVNVLIKIAHLSDKDLNLIYDHPLIGLRSIDVTKYKRAGIGDISEFTVLFYSILALHGNDTTRKKLSKDRDVSNLYKWHLLGLKKFQIESHFRLLHAQHMLNGKYEKAKKAAKKIIELHGISSKNFEDNFYRRLKSYGINE